MQTPAVVRTITPVIAGGIISFFAARGVQVDGIGRDYLASGLTIVITAAYYLIPLVLESRWPKIGVLLGSTARPMYPGRHRRASPSPATATSDSSGRTAVDRQLPLK
ncbi:hypothetical protein [Streptomyces sp. V3I8]|uniref:hypothetical protein n=1 Tax=Streptomyces sp. V3I8 TaxID=3042279 RepID=UPI0027D83287|nr:hypothetical protein [Streptomyces sp. V3I8]